MEKNLIKIIKSCFKGINKEQLELLKKNDIKISDIDNYDSLNYLKFICEMENKFKVKVNKSNLYIFTEFKKILEYINLKHNKKSKKY